jgi:hypothetical protein
LLEPNGSEFQQIGMNAKTLYKTMVLRGGVDSTGGHPKRPSSSGNRYSNLRSHFFPFFTIFGLLIEESDTPLYSNDFAASEGSTGLRVDLQEILEAQEELF